LRVVLDPAGQGHKPTIALIATKVIQKWYLNILEPNLIDNLLFLRKQKQKLHVAYIILVMEN
jgi:hypothetical protein